MKNEQYILDIVDCWNDCDLSQCCGTICLETKKSDQRNSID